MSTMDLTDIADADPEFPEHDGLDSISPVDVIHALIDHYEHVGLNDDKLQEKIDRALHFLRAAQDWIVLAESGTA